MIWLPIAGVGSGVSHAWKIGRLAPECGCHGAISNEPSDRKCLRCLRALHGDVISRPRRTKVFKRRAQRVAFGQLKLGEQS